MPAAVTILYEDQRGQRHGFGLHALVKACVFDAINGDRHRVERMLDDARPLKGVTNVLRACRQDFDLLAADGRTVVAVVDDDVIRDHLKLPHHVADAKVEQEIRKGCCAPERLFVALLHQNTESVIEAAAACDPSLDAKRIARAVRYKDLLERDAILVEMSRERARSLRDCVLGRMPSLRGLIATLTGVLGAPELPARALPPQAPTEKPRRKRKP
jgi:hypothetical protein